LPGRTISIDTQQSIYYLKEFSKHQFPDIKTIKVFDESFVEISDTAPALILLMDNFLLKINEEWYSIISSTEDPLFNVKLDHDVKEKNIHNMCNNAGYTMRQTAIMSSLISSLAEDLSNHAHTQVDSHIVKTILDKNIYERSLKAKATIEQLDMKLEFLRKKLASLEEIKASVDDKLLHKAKKRLGYFSSFLFAQILAIQYGTYVAFSWDVMEPMTNLLGILDVIIAYGFWMATNKSYSYANIGKNYIEKKRERFYKKVDFDVEEYEEIKNLITLLETQKLLLSPKVEDLLKALKLLDTSKVSKDEEEEE